MALDHHDEVLIALIRKNTDLTEANIDDVCSRFSENNVNSASIAHLFIDSGYLTRTEMYRLVKARNFALLRKEDKRIARRAVRRGYITRSQMNDAIDFQKQLFRALGDTKRLHDVLVDEGKLTREQVNEIWAEYREYLTRRGEQPEQVHTDPSLLKRQG